MLTCLLPKCSPQEGGLDSICVPRPSRLTLSVVLRVPFALLCLAQAWPCLSPNLFSADLPSFLRALECPVCHPAPLPMLFPLSRTPFHLFTQPSLPPLSSLRLGIISSQLPELGRSPLRSPPRWVPQVHGVLAFVHTRLPHQTQDTFLF